MNVTLLERLAIMCDEEGLHQIGQLLRFFESMATVLQLEAFDRILKRIVDYEY